MTRICTVCLLAVVLIGAVSACAVGGASRSPGEDLLQTRCRSCHSLGRVETARKTRDNWESTVERMRGYGAQLTNDEASLLIDYLSVTYK